MGRLHRGRPALKRGQRSRGAPTLTRLLALRVLERVQRAGAYADVLLHAQLAHSDLTAPDRAFATELVYGTLRWRGRIDLLPRSSVLDRDLDKLEPLVATALRLGAYQLLFSERVPATAAVDESVRCVRAAGVERATGLVNAVLRRLAAEHVALPIPTLAEDPLAHLTHALSLPGWIADALARALRPRRGRRAGARLEPGAAAHGARQPAAHVARRAARRAARALPGGAAPAASRRPASCSAGAATRPSIRPSSPAASRCRTRPRSWWSRCSIRSPASACSTPAPRRAASPPRIAERVGPERDACSRSTATPRRLDLIRRSARRLGSGRRCARSSAT